jgi:hypothetical protein
LNAKKVGPYGASNRNGSMKGSTSTHLMNYWGSDNKRLFCGYCGFMVISVTFHPGTARRVRGGRNGIVGGIFDLLSVLCVFRVVGRATF